MRKFFVELAQDSCTLQNRNELFGEIRIPKSFELCFGYLPIEIFW